MAANEWYKNWFESPYYHKLYFERDEEEAAAFIKNLLHYLKPAAGSRMLDVGCGRGRFSRLLADQGHDVSGIDLSAKSIQFAQQFAQDHLHFYVHDLRLPFWINYFDFAFSFFTSFGYFATQREHDDAMRTLAAGIKPGGVLVFDYLNVHYVEDHLVHNEVKEVDGIAYEIHRWQDEYHFYKKISITDPSRNDVPEFTEKVAKFSLGDFTDMLSFQKLQVSEVFGDYHLNPYDIRKTPRMILIAKK